MTAKNLDELIAQLLEIYRQRFTAEYQYSRLLDRKGRPMAGKDNDARSLREKIKALDAGIRKMLEDWIKDQEAKVKGEIPMIPSQPLVFMAIIESNIDVLKDAFPMEKIVRSGHVNVPVGQVFVFGHEAMDESGFPEVYLGGETILPKWKDSKSMIVALAEVPGEIRFVSNQWLAGISVSKENTAKISILIPVFLHDPIQTLKRSGGAWMFPDGRRNINHDLCEQVEHHLQDILSDRVQFWSGEPREVLDRVCMGVNRNLTEWGLQVKPESVSIIRQLPKTLYEIVLQFSKAEQAILDSIATGEKALILERSGLTSDDLTFIEATAEREKSGRGEGLFLVLRDKMPNLEEKSDSQSKFLSWLRVHAGASAANYYNDIVKLYVRITKSDFNPTKEPGLGDIRLSEQVVLSAFRNPVIGVGESLNIIG